MRKAICDFCPDPPKEEIIPDNCSVPKGWLDWRVLCKGRAVIGVDKLMCDICQVDRNISVPSPHSVPTIADVILEELYDGIRDIASDVMGG